MVIFFLNLGCGVRQGCPLSPLLYISCSEVLSLLIKNDKEINGIMVNDNIITISAYADDTVLYLYDVIFFEKNVFRFSIDFKTFPVLQFI